MAVMPMQAAAFGSMTLLSIIELVLFSVSRSSPRITSSFDTRSAPCPIWLFLAGQHSYRLTQERIMATTSFMSMLTMTLAVQYNHSKERYLEEVTWRR
jgi:hypothetical protein